jgi:DNA-binding LacI/PurR family transcriptional regulator
LSLGHQTVWHVAGPTDWLEARQRTAGWRRTLEEAGAEVPPPLPGDWSARSGYDAGRVLARMPDVTAIFAANDSMAVGIMRAFHEAGRPIPGAVSLVGFDDVPEAAYYSPPLTTIRQDFGEVGRRSLALLLDQIEAGSRPAQRHVVETTLVVRDSTASTPAAGQPRRRRPSR